MTKIFWIFVALQQLLLSHFCNREGHRALYTTETIHLRVDADVGAAADKSFQKSVINCSSSAPREWNVNETSDGGLMDPRK